MRARVLVCVGVRVRVGVRAGKQVTELEARLVAAEGGTVTEGSGDSDTSTAGLSSWRLAKLADVVDRWDSVGLCLPSFLSVL